MMQARKFKLDIIGQTDARRRHLRNPVYDTGEQLLRTCDSRAVGGIDVLVNKNMVVNIDSFEQLANQIGRLRMRRCGSTPAFTIFVVYAPTSTATLENVMRGLEYDDMGVKVDGRHLHHLRFADDIVLTTSSINQAERVLAEFYETSKKIGLQLNLDKTVFVRNG
ncbi:hypothetical protein RB195_024443 [Necator americanus]|uniref:Reverse transcriptase domain-containing protein n=1 Tax=Necator americanus TaxID=51031 RepID=A0ABR1EN65_NECAM